MPSIRRFIETMEHSEFPASIQLERRSVPERSAVVGRAIQISRCIHDHRSQRILSVGIPREAVQHAEAAGSVQFENRSEPARGTTIASRAVSVSSRISNEAGKRILSIRCPCEAVKES